MPSGCVCGRGWGLASEKSIVIILSPLRGHRGGGWGGGWQVVTCWLQHPLLPDRQATFLFTVQKLLPYLAQEMSFVLLCFLMPFFFFKYQESNFSSYTSGCLGAVGLQWKTSKLFCLNSFWQSAGRSVLSTYRIIMWSREMSSSKHQIKLCSLTSLWS